jgi:4-coumarate--CoA ligase
LARRTAGGRQVNLFIYSTPSSLTVILIVAAGLRCTLANNAYNARELAHQYTDSGASLILTSEEGISVTRETLRNLRLTDDQVDRKIVVLGSSLDWAGGPATPRVAEAAGLLHMEDLLKLGTLAEEEKFDDKLAHETVFLCYSSGGLHANDALSC